MPEKDNEFKQQELDIPQPASSYKDEWANSLFEKLDRLNDKRFLSDSLIFYHIRAWIDLLRKKGYWEVKRQIAFVKSQEKSQKNTRKLSVLQSLSLTGIFKLRKVVEDYSSLSEFVAVLIHLFGKKFACMILTLHQLEGIDESYLSEYYESDDDDDFRDDYYQDFPFFEPWRWRESQSTRHLTDNNNALRKMLLDLRDIIDSYEMDMHDLESKVLELEPKASEYEKNSEVIEEQNTKLEENLRYISSLENQLELIDLKPLEMSKKLQYSIADSKAKDRLVRLRNARIYSLENEVKRIKACNQKLINKNPNDFVAGFLAGVVGIAIFIVLIIFLSAW